MRFAEKKRTYDQKKDTRSTPKKKEIIEINCKHLLCTLDNAQTRHVHLIYFC